MKKNSSNYLEYDDEESSIQLYPRRRLFIKNKRKTN